MYATYDVTRHAVIRTDKDSLGCQAHERVDKAIWCDIPDSAIARDSRPQDTTNARS